MITETLANCIQSGTIYNVQYNELKDLASRQLRTALDSWKQTYAYPAEHNSAEHEVMWVLSDSIINFPSKKLRNLGASVTGPARAELDTIFATYGALSAQFKAAKPLIIKGRKHAENARPARTLYNTGTCSCCGRNVKRRGHRIVAHGYTMGQWGKSANCFGTGHNAIEYSDSGLRAYIKAIQAQNKAQFQCLKPIDTSALEARLAAWSKKQYPRQR